MILGKQTKYHRLLQNIIRPNEILARVDDYVDGRDLDGTDCLAKILVTEYSGGFSRNEPEEIPLCQRILSKGQWA